MNTSHPPRRPPTGGFSLAEILAVLAIIGILMAIALPRFGGLVGASRLDQSMNTLTSDITLARVQAVRAGRPASVRINSVGNQYFIVREPATTPADTIKRVDLRTEFAGLVISPANGGLVFDSRGLRTPATTLTAITASYRGSTRTLGITAMGRVYRVN